MLYDEYKQLFEEILKLTEQLEKMCKKQDLEEFEEVFEKRDKLFQKLETPTDIDQEKVDYICSLRDKFQEKNKFILRFIEVTRNEIKQALIELKQENQVIEAYKIPKGNENASIFDSRE